MPDEVPEPVHLHADPSAVQDTSVDTKRAGVSQEVVHFAEPQKSTEPSIADDPPPVATRSTPDKAPSKSAAVRERSLSLGTKNPTAPKTDQQNQYQRRPSQMALGLGSPPVIGVPLAPQVARESTTSVVSTSMSAKSLHPAAARKLRLLKVAERRHGRTTGHVNNFIRVHVVVSPTTSFSVIADKRQTIEYLSHQIEAEYSYKYLIPVSKAQPLPVNTATGDVGGSGDKRVEGRISTAGDGRGRSSSVLRDKSEGDVGSRKMEGSPERGGEGERDEAGTSDSPSGMEPIECGALCDANMDALKYEDRIGTVLDNDAIVHVIDVYEGRSVWSNLSLASSNVTDTDSSMRALKSPDPSIHPQRSSKIAITDSPVSSSVPSTNNLSRGLSQVSRNSTSAAVMSPSPLREGSVARLQAQNAPGTQPSSPRLHSNFTSSRELTPGHESMAMSPNSMRSLAMIVNPTLDDRIQSILHGRSSLEAFMTFCIEDHAIEPLLFWIEVEILQTLPVAAQLLFAQYIYLTYISSTAPLRVNLSKEIRRDVLDPCQPLDKPGGVATIGDLTSIFDEAQDIVYAGLKGQTFVRFEKGTRDNAGGKWREQIYNTRSKSSTFARYPPNMDLVHDLVTVLLERRQSPMLATAVPHEDITTSFANLNVERGIGEAVSEKLKEQTLKRLINHYYPSYPHPDTLSNYFSETTRLTIAQKQSKIHKDKKIAKFFGERPSFEQIQRQLVLANLPGAGGKSPASGDTLGPVVRAFLEGKDCSTGEGGKLGGVGRSRNDLDQLSMNDSEGSMDDSASLDLGYGGEKHLKMKKVEKLQDFFGANLPKKELKAQHLPGTALSAATSVSEAIMSESPSVAGAPGLEPAPPMQNDLAPEEKRVLTKRSKKLAGILGEHLDEEFASKVVTGSFFASREAYVGGRAGGSGPRVGGALATRASSTSAPNLLGESAQFIAEDIPIPPPVPDRSSATEPTSAYPTLTFLRPRRSASDSSIASLASNVSVPGTVPSPNSREHRKKQLQKLQHFLGKELTPDTLNTAAAAAKELIASRPQLSLVPLTNEERQEQIKRAMKLEKMFGQLPPVNKVAGRGRRASTSSITSPPKFMQHAGLSDIMHDDDEDRDFDRASFVSEKDSVLGMIDTLASAIADPAGAVERPLQSRRRRLSAPSTSFDILPPNVAVTDRARAVARVTKLRKFFGDVVVMEDGGKESRGDGGKAGVGEGGDGTTSEHRAS